MDVLVAMQMAQKAAEEQFEYEEHARRRAGRRRRPQSPIRASLLRRLIHGHGETRGPSGLRGADAR